MGFLCDCTQSCQTKVPDKTRWSFLGPVILLELPTKGMGLRIRFVTTFRISDVVQVSARCAALISSKHARDRWLPQLPAYKHLPYRRSQRRLWPPQAQSLRGPSSAALGSLPSWTTSRSRWGATRASRPACGRPPPPPSISRSLGSPHPRPLSFAFLRFGRDSATFSAAKDGRLSLVRHLLQPTTHGELSMDSLFGLCERYGC